jgi:hypothetical protein
MPVIKELNNIPHFPLWKQTGRPPADKTKAQTFVLSLPSETSDYMRKIGEHFISFIHKLDSAVEEQDLDLYQKAFDVSTKSVGEYWIGYLGDYMA